MDAWLRPTHVATLKVLEATGTGVALAGPGRGLLWRPPHPRRARPAKRDRLARRVMRAFPGDAPILVNSAGCGAALKDYGHLVGTDEARAFSAARARHPRVAGRPASTCCRRCRGAWPRSSCRTPATCVTCSGPRPRCRTVLAHVADVVELDDDGLCCGAGGAYSAMEPELAGAIRERKLDAIERATVRSGARVVASANPGCAIHLRAAGLLVRHPINLVAQGHQRGASRPAGAVARGRPRRLLMPSTDRAGGPGRPARRHRRGAVRPGPGRAAPRRGSRRERPAGRREAADPGSPRRREGGAPAAGLRPIAPRTD